MVDILVKPLELRQTASQMRNSANKIGQAILNIDSDLQALMGDKFLGNRANAVHSLYQSKRDALEKAKELILHFAIDLEKAADVFEKADKGEVGFSFQPGAPPSHTLPNDFLKWAEDSMDRIKNGGELLQGLSIIPFLKNGHTFPDQVKVFGPNWYSKYVVGLEGNIRSINSYNLLDELSSLEVTKWSAIFTGVKLASDIVPDLYKYPNTTEYQGAIIGVNSLVNAGSLAASVTGMKAGAAIGATIGSIVPGLGTGVGTVVGGIAGGLIAGWATDHVMTTPVNEISNGLISSDVTKVSIKDHLIQGTADFIRSSGDFLGEQIYQSFLKQ